MIITHSTFKYQNKVLIEKMKIRTPYRYEAIFQNSGCFNYFREQGPRLLSSEMNTQVKANEAVLLKCGSHFLNLLKETDKEEVEVIVVHLYPEILKKLYIRELPTIIEKQSNSKQSQVVDGSL